MTRRAPLVSETRDYALRTVDEARSRADDAVRSWGLHDTLRFGLPEIDDRYHVWRVPLLVAATAAAGW